ncbi:hypothetical protein PWG15_05455 [Ensifer adhaerens]|uniref:hypothetical protein n=1 Tax=Ensifer adhaerens TaxID=106592 RepID=UPI0023A9EBFB|nr:hypothetical protein [Ensifer adhaerens]WDZ77951.1 hypothetical protein PWG15_05455 [Ensifer adhaerens]
MTEIAAAVAGLFSSAAPAATAATGTAVAAAAPAAGAGFLSSLLQGTATVFSMVSALGAGKADAEQFELAADDAAREKPLETLQGINRRTGIKAEMQNRIAEQDVAYAASGADLSFGTPLQARRDAFREGDMALETDMGTEQTRVARLAEREANYRKRAKRAKSGAVLDAIGIGLKGATSLADRY